MSLFNNFWVLVLFLIYGLQSENSQTTSSWSDVQTELLTKQTLFNNNQFTEYVFSAQRSYCMCAPCSVANKFITVKDNDAIDITFDTADSNSDGCTENNLYDIDYRTINDWFIYAFNYTQQFIHCDTSTTAPECTGDASLSVEYDTTYHLPTQMILDKAAMAYDGGMGYTFGCFSPFDNGQRISVPTSYSTECQFDPVFPPYWSTIQTELITQRDIFTSFDFSDYTYSAQNGPCECMPCTNVKMFITVHKYNVSQVVFDENDFQCSSDDIYNADYRTMLDWFNVAIDYTEAHSHCEDTSSSASYECMDRSLECTYNEDYGYISEIVFDRAAMAYDGGSSTSFCDFGAIVPTTTTTTVMQSTQRSYWELIRDALMEQRDKFKSFDFGDYTYSVQRGPCECVPCSNAKKYAIVRDYNVSDVVFDDNGLDCSSNDLYDSDYRTMMDWFNVAIAYTQQYAHCDDPTGSGTNGECRDISLECTYDAEYGYLTEIVFDRAAMAYDGGAQYYFDCLKPHKNGIVNRYNNAECEDVPTSPPNKASVFAKWWIMVVLFVMFLT